MKKINKKTNTYFVGSMFLNILSTVVVGFVLISLFYGILESSYAWLVYAIAAFLYIAIVYTGAHSVGDNDANCNVKVKFKGELCGFIAVIPSLILSVLCFLLEIGVLSTDGGTTVYTVVYRGLHICFRIIFDYFKAYPYLYFVPPVLTYILTIIGYRFGEKRFKISDYLYYAREDKK